jgi:hypothetical protein
MDKRFPESKLHARLQTYDEAALLRLHDIVTKYADAELSRADVLERKATVIVGYAGAIITAIAPWLFKRHLIDAAALVWVGLFALASIALAFCAMAAHSRWPWVPDKYLFPATGSDGFDAKEMLSMRIRVVHDLYAKQLDRAQSKGLFVLCAQASLVAAIGVLGVAIILV